MKNFALALSNATQKPILNDFSPFQSLLSFGVFWQDSEVGAEAQANMQASELKGRATFALHPLFLPELESLRDSYALRYEVGTELGVAWLLAHALCHPLTTQDSILHDFSTLLDELDVGYLASESNLSEEELESLSKWFMARKSTPLAIVLGSELALHRESKEICKLLALLSLTLQAHKVEHSFILPELDERVLPSHAAEPSLPLPCHELPESNGNFIYIIESTQADSTPSLRAPALFAPSLRLQDSELITLSFESQHIKARYAPCPSLKGTIALLALPQARALGYPYKKVEVIL